MDEFYSALTLVLNIFGVWTDLPSNWIFAASLLLTLLRRTRHEAVRLLELHCRVQDNSRASGIRHSSLLHIWISIMAFDLFSFLIINLKFRKKLSSCKKEKCIKTICAQCNDHVIKENHNNKQDLWWGTCFKTASGTINTTYKHVLSPCKVLQKVFRGKKKLVLGCPANETNQSWSWCPVPTAVMDFELGH